MKKLILPLLALFAIGCGSGDNKMPWEGGGDEPTDKPNPDVDPTVAEVGKALPLWSEGELDIHFINSARGECCFYIMPDGTTMIVDAGELTTNYGTAPCPQRPNSVIRPYETYGRYIKHFMPQGQSAIDYCAPSHFHIDHIGDPDTATETAAAGYKKSGLLALYDLVPYAHIIDRSYPDYKEDGSTPAMEGELSAEYAKFVKWGVKEGKFTGARFTPGTEQMVMLYDREAYSNFRIFNICANGYVWNKNQQGAGYLAGSKSGEGNPASCGFHINYGKFDYVACGDLTSTPQNLAANYCRDFIGENKTDAFKAHHHLSANSWGSQMQKDFKPRVIINHSFYKSQPNGELLTKILDNVFTFSVKDFFTTNCHSENMTENQALYSRIKGANGHIVLRVAKGGDSYSVYLLDDSNFDYIVKAIHGPYTAK